jgi:thiamine-monophosphate kinase
MLVRRAHAVIDVSDGLGGDAGKLAAASSKRVVIESDALEQVIRPELRVVAEWLGTSARALALGGGEDYALLACGPAKHRLGWARRIGRVEEGTCAVLENERHVVPLEAGFDHLLG